MINSQFKASRDSVVEIAQGKKLTQNLKKKKKKKNTQKTRIRIITTRIIP